MSTTTTNMGLTKPALGDTADITIVDTDLDTIDGHHHGTNASGLAVRRINSGVFASRPAFGTAGQVYVSTDSGLTSYDTGAAWVDGITLTSVGNLSGKTYAATLTGAVAAARFVGGTASGAPVTGTFAVGDVAVDQTGLWWLCTVLGTPGTWVNTITPASVGNLTGKTYTATLTGAVAAARFVGGTATVAPTTGTFLLGDYVVAQNGTAWVCTVAGSPGTWVQIGAASATLLTTATNILGGDVACNNASNFFDGPSMAQGTSGTWWCSGTVSVGGASSSNIDVKLWDGTTIIASARAWFNAASTMAFSLTGFLASPAANIRMSVRSSATNASITFNTSGQSKDCSVFGLRIA